MGNRVIKWVESDSGWIDAEDGTPVVEYAGCSSHEAEWASEQHKQVALAAPEMMGALLDWKLGEESGDYDTQRRAIEARDAVLMRLLGMSSNKQDKPSRKAASA